MHPHISVVIPVYKAAECLNELYVRLVRSLESITHQFEIILIEDCGGDESWNIIQKLSKQDSRVKGMQFSRNFGQHYGITAGLDYCTGDWAVIMDCDLQDRPEEIPKLYQKALEGYDVVLAHRNERKDSILKRSTSNIFYKIFNYFLDFNYDGRSGNFRIISRTVIESFRSMREQLRFFGGLIAWMGFPTAEVSVQHSERFAGKSSYNFKKLWRLAWDGIIAYSDKPLRLTIRLGFLLSFIAFIFGIYIIFHAMLQHTAVAGWASLIVSLYFIGGIVIYLLGIIGIYLGKTFDETKKRPLYIIREKTDGF